MRPLVTALALLLAGCPSVDVSPDSAAGFAVDPTLPLGPIVCQ